MPFRRREFVGEDRSGRNLCDVLFPGTGDDVKDLEVSAGRLRALLPEAVQAALRLGTQGTLCVLTEFLCGQLELRHPFVWHVVLVVDNECYSLGGCHGWGTPTAVASCAQTLGLGYEDGAAETPKGALFNYDRGWLS
jgi:hypothetical protein